MTAVLLMAFSLAPISKISQGENSSGVKTGPTVSATPSKVDLKSKDEEKPKAPEPEQRGKKTAPPQTAQTVMRKAIPPEMAQLFPIGRIFKGVIIPSYNEVSVIESVMNSSIVTRRSKDYIDFTDLVIFFYNSAEKPETSIQMDQAKYNLETGILTSKTPANIKQDQFTMRGDTMTFAEENRRADLIGHVRMLIFDDKDESPVEAANRNETVEITSRKSSMDNAKRKITFHGDVLVLNKKDHVTMKCDKLEVFLLPEGARVKDASGKQSKISRIIASGEMVEIRTVDEDGKPQIALARIVNYNAITKNAVLFGGPPSIQDGKGNFVLTNSKDAKIILRNDEKYLITGSQPHTITIPIKGEKRIGDLGFGKENTVKEQ